MGFSQKRVARLIGHRDGTLLSKYELGHGVPTLATALSIGIVLRVPVEFLFPALYESLRNEIRAKEEQANPIINPADVHDEHSRSNPRREP